MAITLVAPFLWTPMQGWADWCWMLALCVLGVLGHFLLIKAYEVAEAGTDPALRLLPARLHRHPRRCLLFDERPDAWTVAGAALILAAGLYTLLRQRAAQPVRLMSATSWIGVASPFSRAR